MVREDIADRRPTESPLQEREEAVVEEQPNEEPAVVSESQAERDYDRIMTQVVREFQHWDENHNDFFIDPEAPIRVDSHHERTFGSQVAPLSQPQILPAGISEPSIPEELGSVQLQSGRVSPNNTISVLALKSMASKESLFYMSEDLEKYQGISPKNLLNGKMGNTFAIKTINDAYGF